MSLNKVILIGRLGHDPEFCYMTSGEGVCNFSLATSEQWRNQAGNRIERTAYDIIANEMKMLGGRQDNPQGEVPAPPTAKPITSEQYRAASGGSTRRQPAPVTPASDIDGDIPY